MHVIAFSSPSRPAWRWRLISYAGDIVEESREVFGTIAAAIGAGASRSEELRVHDISQPALPYSGLCIEARMTDTANKKSPVRPADW